MARSIYTIYNSICTEKASMSSLSGLLPNVDNLPGLLTDLGNSPSKVAVWRLWAFIMAVCIFTHETLWDNFMTLVNSIIAAKKPGTVLWYQQQGFTFQYGDSLSYINGKWQYAVIDPTKQIVNRVAIIELGGAILVKAAISTGSVITPLSTPQLTAFSAYYKKIKYAGPAISCVSFDPDLLWIPYEVFYDPLADPATLRPLVEAAIQAYLDKISGLLVQAEFNGVFDLNDLNNEILAVPQVTDTIPGNVQWTYGLLAYSPVVRKQLLNAGYCIIDPAHALSTTITLTADV